MPQHGIEREVLRRRSLVGIGWIVSVILAVTIGWFAAAATLKPSESVPTETARPVVVRAGEGRVGKTLDFSATASWPLVREVLNGAEGMVTAVSHAPATTVKAGDVLYDVDLGPVVAIKGGTPMFRDLTQGSEGPDVGQVRAFLVQAGYLSGSGTSFDSATATAVRRWQEALGVPATGTVTKRSVLFLPDLPARVTLSEEIEVGRVVSAGVGSARVLGPEPSFFMRITPDQANLIPLDADVLVGLPGQAPWSTRMGPATTERDGQVSIPLLSPSTRSVCGAECAKLEGANDTVLPAKVVIVPETSGVTLPRAAIRSLPDGSQQVVLEGGATAPVKVRAESGGTAVVEGIAVGVAVELPGGR